MARTVRLRPWQKAALDAFVASERPDFLAVATPGAGKTTFALTAARYALAAVPARVVVVAPTAHLKLQWARAAAEFALHLDPAWSPAEGAPPRDMHGIVTTYQQVAASADVLARLTSGAFVVFDELHHAAEDRAWGDAVGAAFGGASRRLALSGTPFRSDTRAIPFIAYDGDEARPDYEYGYGDALYDRTVVRPVFFPRTNGEMEWQAPDGAILKATFDDSLDAARSSQRLRTALSLDGEWLPTVLRAANERLAEVRKEQPDAGGLVIAIDREHARGIAKILKERLGAPARVVTADDPKASAAIEKFARGKEPWLVAVRMVSEGVDIPRLRVGVYATTTTTELFFRQAVGRLVRWMRGVAKQRAWLYIPDDPKLRVFAHAIAEQRRHSLQRREEEPLLFERNEAGAEQTSMFAVISAIATDHVLGELPAWELDGEHDDGIEVELSPPPLVAAGPEGVTRREDKQGLRAANAALAAELSRRTGLTHARVNAELNKLAGVKRVAQATSDELRKRLAAGNRWLAKT